MEHTVPYRTYWVAWLCLLVITLVMVFVTIPGVLIAGMIVKASIIALWFMHLRYEPLGFTLAIVLGTLLTGLLLFALIAPDGTAM